MPHLKTLAILAASLTLNACVSLPDHPAECVCTYWGDIDAGFCYTSEDNPRECGVVKSIDMQGYTCRSPEANESHQEYISALERIAKQVKEQMQKRGR